MIQSEFNDVYTFLSTNDKVRQVLYLKDYYIIEVTDGSVYVFLADGGEQVALLHP